MLSGMNQLRKSASDRTALMSLFLILSTTATALLAVWAFVSGQVAAGIALVMVAIFNAVLIGWGTAVARLVIQIHEAAFPNPTRPQRQAANHRMARPDDEDAAAEYLQQ